MFMKQFKEMFSGFPRSVYQKLFSTHKNNYQEKAVGTAPWIKIYVLELINVLFENNFKSKRFEYKPLA